MPVDEAKAGEPYQRLEPYRGAQAKPDCLGLDWFVMADSRLDIGKSGYLGNATLLAGRMLR